MDLLQSKIFSIATLGLSSIFVGFLPSCFANRGHQLWPLCLSSLLCFGAGVLLATSLVHILPELREVVPNGYKQYSELVFCLGFFILYVLDEIVHYFYGDTHELTGLHNLQPHEHIHNGRRHSANSKQSYGATERDGLLYKEKQLPYNPAFYRAKSDSVLFCDEPPPSQLCHVGHQEPCNAAPTANIGLLTALSVHALLEGLVVGLEAEPEKVLLLLGAIASHKLVVAFCLGMELASNPSYTRRRLLTYIFIFSFGSVAGIIIGMIISNIPSEFKNVAIPVLQGLAGGTLLYVTVSEVLPRERARWHKQHDKRAAGIFQCLSVLLGFILMATLSKYLGEHKRDWLVQKLISDYFRLRPINFNDNIRIMFHADDDSVFDNMPEFMEK